MCRALSEVLRSEPEFLFCRHASRAQPPPLRCARRVRSAAVGWVKVAAATELHRRRCSTQSRRVLDRDAAASRRVPRAAVR